VLSNWYKFTINYYRICFFGMSGEYDTGHMMQDTGLMTKDYRLISISKTTLSSSALPLCVLKKLDVLPFDACALNK
jgi:hypothetical protein